jgi:hypothetical protein
MIFFTKISLSVNKDDLIIICLYASMRSNANCFYILGHSFFMSLQCLNKVLKVSSNYFSIKIKIKKFFVFLVYFIPRTHVNSGNWYRWESLKGTFKYIPPDYLIEKIGALQGFCKRDDNLFSPRNVNRKHSCYLRTTFVLFCRHSLLYVVWRNLTRLSEEVC